MGESAAGTTADADTSESSNPDLPPIIDIATRGDIVLDVTFETSSETLKQSRKAVLAASRKAGTKPPPPSALKAKERVAYRVSLETLKKHSKYFSNLLTNPSFREAKIVADAHERLVAGKVKPGEADVIDLPWITITDDDTASKAAGRETVLEDMLNILHQKPPITPRVTMAHVTTLAIVADRFDCASAVSRALSTELKFKWPLTSTRPLRAQDGTPTDTEQALRQKILVSWLLAQSMKFQQSARELVIRGSSLWSDFIDPGAADMTAVWWNLPDGLEEELRHRRERILNTIASVQRHFLRLYSSRERQCPLGYDTSAACDSFQLGQMYKFFTSKNLAVLVDFSPMSLDAVPDGAMIDIEELLGTLQKCPNYQIDKHHANCGLRVRLEPILAYLRTMLAANTIAIPHADWKRRRSDVSWLAIQERGHAGSGGGGGGDDPERSFAFTRAIANDQRLRYEGAIYADKMAKAIFTADAWDWTPES